MVNKLGDWKNEKIQNAERYKFMELFYAFSIILYTRRSNTMIWSKKLWCHRWTVKLEIKEDQIWHTLYQIILENIRVVISFWKVMLLSLYTQGGSQNSQKPTRGDKISITLFSRRLYQFCRMLCMLQVMNIGFSLDLHWF